MKPIRHAITIEYVIWREMGDSWRDLTISMCDGMKKDTKGNLWFLWADGQTHLFEEMKSVLLDLGFRYVSTTWLMEGEEPRREVVKPCPLIESGGGD